MSNLKITIAVLLTAVVVAPSGFFAGIKYQQNKTQTAFGRDFTRTLNGQTRSGVAGARSGMNGIQGEITAIDDKSMTVKSSDGQSRIVFFSDSTSIRKTETTDKTVLRVGEAVSVFGQENSDKTINAQSIQLNPAMSTLR